MTSPPVEELAETLVKLADTLVDGFDLDGFLRLLAEQCVLLLGAASSGLLLIDGNGSLTTAGTATELVNLEATHGEGPTVDSCHGGGVIVVPDIAVANDRWPRFSAAAQQQGVAAVHTVPMRLRAEVIGAVSLFRTAPGQLSRVDARLAQSLVDIAAIGILQRRAVRRNADLADQLQHALDSRVIIEQAKGVVAERFGMGMPAAFEAIRNYARSHNKKVSDLASSIVDGEFDTRGLLG